jgi:hypothetical protein
MRVKDAGAKILVGYAGAMLPSSFVISGSGDDKIKSVSLSDQGLAHGIALDVGVAHSFLELGGSAYVAVAKTRTADVVVLSSGLEQRNAAMSVSGFAFDFIVGGRLPLWFAALSAGSGIGYGSWEAHVDGDDTTKASGSRLDIPLWAKAEIVPICQLALGFRATEHLSFGRDAFNYPTLSGYASVIPVGCK